MNIPYLQPLVMDSKEKENILLLDGGHKKTLAILRTLGKKRNYQIDVGASSKKAICFFSKYIGHKILFPDPRTDPQKYQSAILKVIQAKPYINVIPTDYISFLSCSEIQQEINTHSYLRVATPTQLRLASDKYKMVELCNQLNIPTPKTINIRSVIDLYGLHSSDVEVLKSSLEKGDNFLAYPSSIDHAKDLAQRFFSINEDDSLLAQRKINGHGFGFFAYYKKGVCQQYFIHRRLREYPPSGGYSVAAEGAYDEKVLTQGKKILDHLQWDGIAMVEFKHDEEDDQMYFMEVNPKYWGSIELAIKCGVDFPQMMIDDAQDKPLKNVEHYAKRKFQWILNGELFHFLARPSSFGDILADLSKSYNDIWWRDLVPNFYQIFNIPMHYLRKWKK